MAPIQPTADSDSLLHLSKIAQWVCLPPASLANPLPALCAQVLSPLLLSYYPPADGIVLAWQDVELSETPPVYASTESSAKPSKATKKSSRKAQQEDDDESSSSGSDGEDDEEHVSGKSLHLRVIDEYSAPFIWCTATLLVLRPRKNAWIEGRVSSQASTHITLSYLNVFSVSVVSQHLPKDWAWASTGSGYSMTGGLKAGEQAGYWMDGDGSPVGQTLKVRIKDWDARTSSASKDAKGFLRIEGSLVSEDEEAGVAAAHSAEKRKEKGKKAKSALKTTKKTSAQTGGDAMEVE